MSALALWHEGEPMVSYKGNDRDVTASREEVHDMIKVAVAEGVDDGIKRTFATLGLDLLDPDALVEEHADRKFLRDLREAAEHRQNAAIVAQAQGRTGLRNGIITVILAAIVSWVAAHFGSKP